MSSKSSSQKNILKISIVALAILVVVFLLRKFGIFQYLSPDNMARLREWIVGFGILGPIIYILLWVAACIFFLPGLPVALLGGVAFGPLWGTIYTSIGSTVGATLAFLIARYAARGMVEGWVEGNDKFKKIDDGVRKQGWRMLMITRLVPVFPFNLQNYVYGLTNINLFTYVVVSWICMLPGAMAFCFAGGSLSSGGSLQKTFMYLGIAAVGFVVLSLIPGWIKKRQNSDLGLSED